jgi:type IV pilus assembly protein PilV
MNKPISPAPKSALKQKSAQRGMALLEALVSILLFSMGVLALVGLQSTMIKNTSDSQFRSQASFIAQQWLGIMWADPTNLPLYAIDGTTNPPDLRFHLPPESLPNGTRSVAVSGVEVTITINWQQPGKPSHQLITLANIIAN